MPVSESSAMHQLRRRSAQKPQLDCLSRILQLRSRIGQSELGPLGPLLLRRLKQTGQSEIAGWNAFIGSVRPHLESWGVGLCCTSVWVGWHCSPFAYFGCV